MKSHVGFHFFHLLRQLLTQPLLLNRAYWGNFIVFLVSGQNSLHTLINRIVFLLSVFFLNNYLYLYGGDIALLKSKSKVKFLL